MLSREQQREVAAVAVLGIAVLFSLSLFPAEVFGSRSLVGFPSGNMVGVFGVTIRDILFSLVGVASVIVPVVVIFLGLQLSGWMVSSRALRFGLLFFGMLFLVPIATWIATQSPVSAGWIGTTLGNPLVGLLGVVGGTVVTTTAFVALSVTTLGWNPRRLVGRGFMVGGDAASRTMKVVADRGREVAAQALADQRERELANQVVLPVEGMEPEWAKEEDSPEDVTCSLEQPTADPLAELSTDVEITCEDEQDDDPEISDIGTGYEVASDEVGDEPAEEVTSEKDSKDEGSDPSGIDDQAGLDDPNAGVLVEHEVPPVDLLSAPESADRASMERQLDALGQVLIEKLATFNIKSSLGGRTTGPVVTQFEVVPAPGVKVNRIANLDADLALAMTARTIRIVAPIPGKGAVGVEIPNPNAEIVNLREILEAREFGVAKGVLPLALGKDLNGKPYVSPLEKMPHVLIAGATGAGKSVCLNTIVTSLVYRHTPETLRLLLIDPKMVELSVYSRLPHLRHNVVTDPRDAAGF